MSAPILFTNTGSSYLAQALAANATTATLAIGTGSQFPSPGVGQYFSMTFVSAANSALNEIVYVTNVTGDVLTIIRGQEGTNAQSWNAGDYAYNLVTAGVLEAFQTNALPVAGGTMTGPLVMSTSAPSLSVFATFFNAWVASLSTTLPPSPGVVWLDGGLLAVS